MSDLDELIDALHTESDLCANEGVDDLASLLYQAAKAIEELRRDPSNHP